MKKIIILFAFTIFIVCVAGAQTNKELVEKNWKGSSVTAANFTKDGKVYLSQTINLTLNTDNTITGTGIIKMNLDGVIYSCTTAMSGTLNTATNSIYIKDGYQYNMDVLPSGLRWCKGWGTLTFYSNSTHPGYFLLKGKIDDDCGGSSDLELSDY